MKKIFSIAGMASGLLIIVLGVLTVLGVLGTADSFPGYTPYYYDSGYAEFGADYYTFSVNNSAEAASAARAVAYNIRDFANLMQKCIGWLLVSIGIALICGFGIVFSGCAKAPEPVVHHIAKEPELNNDAPEAQTI